MEKEKERPYIVCELDPDSKKDVADKTLVECHLKDQYEDAKRIGWGEFVRVHPNRIIRPSQFRYASPEGGEFGFVQKGDGKVCLGTWVVDCPSTRLIIDPPKEEPRSKFDKLMAECPICNEELKDWIEEALREMGKVV